MIKEKNIAINYYHLSPYSNIKIAIPKVSPIAPSFEDTTTPRVCFSYSIDLCLSALQPCCKVLYVYTPDDMEEFLENMYKPKIYQVRDCKETGEVWIKKKIKVKCIGKIRVGPTVPLLEKKCKNYKGTFYLIKYRWEWLEKY